MRELLITAPKKLSGEDVQKTWADYDGYGWRIDPNYEADQCLHRYMLVAGGTTRVLDLGSGPFTSLGQIGPGLRRDERRTFAITNRLTAPATTSAYVPVDVKDGSLPTAAGLSITAAITAGGTATHDGESPSPPQADDWASFVSTTESATAAVFDTASLLDDGAGTASAEAAPVFSSSVVILETAPSAQLAADVVGSSMPAAYLPVAQANTTLCCGMCGYINCPTQLLSQAPGNVLPLSGQLPGSGADFVSTGQNRILAGSMSDPMLSRQVAPVADWNGQLPGGGETATGSMTGQVGILSGSVTTAVAPQITAADASSNLFAAAAATNPIVLENQKPGSPESEWGIDGAGDSNIEGFATDISVNHGNTINFKINTNSSNYRIDIYRLGYYGGMGATKVATLQHTGLQNQPAPLRDATTGEVDAGNWAVSASWAVPADAVSGVYIAKLTRQDGTAGANHIPFIVRDDSSHSDVLFQTADETWQAYNGWGGANFYGGNGPATGQGAGRAYALSYNRPIATRGGVGTFAGPQDYLFGAEYASISWLEQNGYDVSYMAGVDVDRFGSLLLNHKVYVDTGHDEYWSGQQRTNVEAARDAGVNLQFWSGNEVYWRTRWGNALSSDATPYRTLISYKETWANSSIDPTNQWTGTFRDPRFSPPAIGGGSPENALTGTIFQVDDVGANLQSIKIPYDDANLRFWANTSVANLQPGQTATLTKNYLGYEWDDAPDNGFDPAGLVRLSSTTIPVSTYLLDYGNTTGNGVSTHSLTLYRAPSGALVFGAGTVYWSWGLSDNHDKEVTPTDPRVQQAMVNLFADMGVQPGTLQSGLITGAPSTDHTAPTSVFNSPASVNAGTTVVISGTASDVGGVIAGVEISTDSGASWHPVTGDETWTYSWTPPVAGTYTILSRAVDDSINLETPSAGHTVTVTGPSYITLFPGSATPAILNTTDASAVELGVRFQSSVTGTVSGIRFYKSSQDTGTHTGELWSSTGTKLATATFTNESASGWQSVTFSSPVTVTPGATYTASYHTNVGHYSNTGNYFTADVTSGPLTAPASGNGVYAYGSTSLFPTSTFQATNFWVDVLFTPAGANTTPTAVADTGDATEKGGIANGSGGSPASGNVLTNDTDPDAGDTKTVTAVKFGATAGTLGTALAGAHGSLVLSAAGAFTYTVNETDAAVQGLRQSTDTVTDVFSYTMRDTAGATSTTTLTVAVHGANDAPTLTAQTGSQNAVVGSAFSLVLPAGTFADVDAGDSLIYTATAADGSSLPAWLGFNAATRTFSGTPTAAGTLGVKVSATDLGSLAASETFNIVVTTTPDTPPTAVADTADATEKGGIANGSGGSPASGNVLTNDTDPDAGDTKTVTAVKFGATAGTLGTALAGAHGSLVLNAAGDFTYTVNETDAAVQGLRQSTDTLTDVFNYTMRDTAGVTSTTTLTVRILGANDAPALAAQTGSQNATVGSAFSLVLPAGTFTDVDAGDSLTYTATAADGSALPAWLSFNAATRTFSGTPTAANVGTLSVKVSATDLGSLAASETFNIAVTTAPTTVSLFTASNTPAQTNLNDGSPLEVGVKFQSSIAGQITALKFYRSASDTGADILDLWTTTGTNLASVTFTNTAASGWQTVSLTTPVAISANTNYVASYHTTGAYVATDNFFTTAFTSGVLTAPSTTTAGGNGVYAYGGTVTTGIFPTNTFGATNYWADVVFASSALNTTPTAVADTANATEKGGIANGSGGSPASGNVITNDTDPDAGDTKTVTAVKFGATNGTLGTALTGAHGSLVLNASGAFAYTVNETDAAVQGLRQSTDTVTDVFSYTMRDTAGATSTTTLTVAVHGANDAPTLTAQTGSQNAVVGSAFSLPLPAGTFADVDAGDSLTYTATAADGSALPAWLGFNAATRTFSGTPTAAGTLGVKVSATDLGSLAASETFNIVVTTTPDTPPTAVADTANATEKGGIANGSGGSPASGNVLTNDTDPDAGDTKTVTAVNFGATAGTLGTALAGAHGSLVLNASGTFTYTVNETDAAVQGLRQATDTLTDVFSYTMRDTAGATSTTTLTVSIHGANDAPTLAVQTGSQNATVGSPFSLVLPAGTFSDVDAGDSLTYTATAADGSALPAWLSFNAATRTFSGTPTAANVGTLSVKVSATDLGSLAASETFNIAVTTAPTTVSLFTASNTPAQTNLNDGSPLEVGVKFQSSVAGQITALKFYRSASDTGADILDLWTTTGTNLASVTFTNTTASGWQTVALSTPVAISANTTYVASYHTTGAYVATNNFFTTAFTSGVLTAPSTTTAGGNGVYAYGGTVTTGIFPTNTFGAANYWADVVFASSAPNTTPTAVADTGDATEKGGIANGSGGSPASGNVLTNDTDPDAGDTKTVTAVKFGATNGTLGTALAGAHGSLVLNASGAFTYTVNETDAAVQGLRQATDTLTDGFSYTMRDTAGATSTTTLTVSILGANDAPTLAAQTGSQNAVVGSAFSLVLPAGTFADVDAGDSLTYTATAADGSALPAWLGFNAATRTFSGTPTAAGTLGVKVSATDLGSLAASETFNIVVTTTPDTPPTAVADTADATEKGGIANGSGGSPASGNVLTNDTDPDAGDTKTVTAVNFGATAGTLGTALAGAHGSLVLNAAGDFAYTVNETDAAVQGLRQATDKLTDVFSYTMGDTAGATSTTTLTVSILGANDAPTLAVQTANQNAAVGSPFSLVLPAGTFSDVDAGDTLSYTATAADGSALPAWLTFNAATRTFSGTPAATNVGTFVVKVSATDLGSLAASETFNIAVTTTPVNAPTISNLVVSATSISFVASDPDNATLSLASPFASVFGNPSIASGATTTLTPSVRTTAVSGTLQVTDGSATADVVGLYLGTGGSNTATAPNPTAPNAMYGFGGTDKFTGGAAADSIFGGAGADTLSGGDGNDTFNLANGDFVSGESIDGGADADAIVLTNATTVNFTSGTVSNVETLTGSSGNDTITMSATQGAGFSTINLGSGTNVLNVVASGDISVGPTPTVNNVTTGNLTGTSGNDTITLTGAQLDAIISGAGTINLSAGTDTINLTSTSADLNTLGATNASIQGVEAISAATAASGVTITLSSQTEGFTITGSKNDDTITGGRGADTITGGAGVDRFVFNSGSSPGTVGGSGDAGTITGYDVITDLAPNAGGDVLDMPNVNVRANETVNGTDSALTIAGQQIKSHQINNGIITFSNNDTFSSGTTFSLASLANVAAAVDYIHGNDFATSTGANMGFVANIGGTAHTYIFNQIGNNRSATNDVFVDLVGVTLTTLSGANLAPAGVAGEAINLGLTNPTDHLGSITVNISGVPSGWSMSEGSDNGDGTWSLQTYDVSALSITAPENYAGAVSLQISQIWTDSTGGTGLAMITNNVEAYASGAPIFAISGDDNLSGSNGNDVFVLANPIGNNTIHSFDFPHDKVDLIGLSGLSSFVDVQTRLSENSNGDAVITIAEGGSITFAGVSAASLTADNFVFNLDTVMDNANIIVIGDNAVLPLAGTVNNSGTIELTSIGGQTRLQVLANGLTLEGGGHVGLSDGNGNIIVGTTPDATLTNVDNTISGAGQLGEGQLTLHNKGTIIASGSKALTIDTGANAVVNSGTLGASGSGGLVIHSDIANSGLLWANGSSIKIDGNVTGTGSALIDGVATFEMGGSFGQNVTLDAGANATLKIDHAADFSGAVAGFDGNDVLDLADIAFGSNTTLGYAANSNNTGGSLTVSDGTHTANIELLGQYIAASFVISADGVGGTLIHDLPPAALTHTLTQPQHA